MNKREAEKLERELFRAMEKVIERGYYPRRDVMEQDGGCCAIGAWRIMKHGSICLDENVTPCDDALPTDVWHGITYGFDGEMISESIDPEAYAIGKRLAKHYL